MTGMNRLSPWIVRRLRPARLGSSQAFGAASAAAVLPVSGFQAAAPPAWLDDVRLFFTGWVGGLVFFGTLLG